VLISTGQPRGTGHLVLVSQAVCGGGDVVREGLICFEALKPCASCNLCDGAICAPSFNASGVRRGVEAGSLVGSALRHSRSLEKLRHTLITDSRDSTRVWRSFSGGKAQASDPCHGARVEHALRLLVRLRL